jgi:hypothetical protein
MEEETRHAWLNEISLRRLLREQILRSQWSGSFPRKQALSADTLMAIAAAV